MVAFLALATGCQACPGGDDPVWIHAVVWIAGAGVLVRLLARMVNAAEGNEGLGILLFLMGFLLWFGLIPGLYWLLKGINLWVEWFLTRGS